MFRYKWQEKDCEKKVFVEFSPLTRLSSAVTPQLRLFGEFSVVKAKQVRRSDVSGRKWYKSLIWSSSVRLLQKTQQKRSLRAQSLNNCILCSSAVGKILYPLHCIAYSSFLAPTINCTPSIITHPTENDFFLNIDFIEYTLM